MQLDQPLDIQNLTAERFHSVSICKKTQSNTIEPLDKLASKRQQTLSDNSLFNIVNTAPRL